jgi:hypothetical protein
MRRLRMGIFVLLVFAAVSTARAGIYDDETIPGKWLKPLVPERAEEPQYPDYDKNSDFDKAWDQCWAGQYRRALVTLESVKRGKPIRIAHDSRGMSTGARAVRRCAGDAGESGGGG